MPLPKGKKPPRYDKEFKDGAMRLVVEQGRATKDVAIELGICPETLRNWLKSAGLQPRTLDHSNRDSKRIKELEAQVRELKRQVTDKDEVIVVLKKSVGILSTP